MWGSVLRRVRVEAGISQEALALLVGVVRPTIWRWERGDSTPSPTIYKKLRSQLPTLPCPWCGGE